MLAGASCWVLYVDVLVLEMGGKDDVFAFDSLCPCLSDGRIDAHCA